MLFRTQLTLRGSPISDCVGYEDEHVNYRDPTAAAAYGAWNPGLESELPREYLPLATIFRAENVSTSAAKAHELRDYCGLPPHELVAFRPERLIVHELLVRLTSSLAVPDGPDQEDLGKNFRRMASTILDKHIAPHRIQITELFERLRSAAMAVIAQEFEASLCPRLEPAADAGRSRPSLWPFRFGKRKPPPPTPENAEQRERRIIAEWSERARGADGRLAQACYDALSRIATAITARRGRLLASKDLLIELAVTQVCNDYGSEVIGDAIEPFIQEAVSRDTSRCRRRRGR